MKAHFTCMALLIAGFLFPGDTLAAESSKSSKPAATVAAEGSGTNQTDSTAGSVSRSGAATNSPATHKHLRAIQIEREHLDALSAQLSELLTKYNEKDKRVRVVRKQIADVQKQLASELAAKLPAGGSGSNRTESVTNASLKNGDEKAKAIAAIANPNTYKTTNVRLLTSASASVGSNAPATDKHLRAIQKQRERLDALSVQLNELLTKYAEKNRRVRAIRKQIADVQKQLASEPAATLPPGGSGTRTAKASDASAMANNATTKSTTVSARSISASADVGSTTAKATNATVNTGTNALTNVGFLTSAATSGGNNATAKITIASAEATAPAIPNSTNATAKDINVTAKIRRLSSVATSGTNGTASRNLSVNIVNLEKDDKLNRPVPAVLAGHSNSNVDHSAPAPSLSSDAGSNAPANTNASVNLVTMETLDDKHRLAIGDRLSFRIEEDKYRLAEGDKLSIRTENEPTRLLVTDSGELEVPYIGRYPAENKTCKQLAYELKAALEKDYFYKATVILAVDLKAKSLGRVYLTGAVHVPGPQEIPSDEVLTLGKAILRAGGFTDFAERTKVKVTRKAVGSSETKTLVVDVAEVFDKGKIERDLPLEPDDLIMVSERMIRF